MDWIDFSKKPPDDKGIYLIHCTGINVSYTYQIGNWDGLNFWSVPGNQQYPSQTISGGKTVASIAVDYYANIKKV